MGLLRSLDLVPKRSKNPPNKDNCRRYFNSIQLYVKEKSVGVELRFWHKSPFRPKKICIASGDVTLNMRPRPGGLLLYSNFLT